MIALLVVVAYDGVLTFAILKLIGLVVPLRMPDEELRRGDAVVHGETADDMGVEYDGPSGHRGPLIPSPAMAQVLSPRPSSEMDG